MRRETLWLQGTFAATTLASTNAVALTASLNAGALALRPFTIVRTRGHFTARSDQDAVDEVFALQMGFAVVSDQAVAIGVTAVPTPDTDMGSDAWFVYEQCFGLISVTTDVGRLITTERVYYDSKAMRRVEDGFDVVQVIECPSSSAIFNDAFRMLIKLH